MDDINNSDQELVALSADVVAAYVSNHDVPVAEIPDLVHVVHTSLRSLTRKGGDGFGKRPDPAVSPQKSVFADYIICLEDGKKLKMLRRHLKTVYNMTPEQYRIRWGLPSDYPVVAPNYAQQRSKLAKQIGLGSSRKKA